jgi:hypothetical protein
MLKNWLLIFLSCLGVIATWLIIHSINHQVPKSVLEFISAEVTRQCGRQATSLTYPSRQITPDGAIYASEFTETSPDRYLIVVQTAGKLVLEDLRCPTERKSLLAF